MKEVDKEIKQIKAGDPAEGNWAVEYSVDPKTNRVIVSPDSRVVPEQFQELDGMYTFIRWINLDKPEHLDDVAGVYDQFNPSSVPKISNDTSILRSGTQRDKNGSSMIVID